MTEILLKNYPIVHILAIDIGVNSAYNDKQRTLVFRKV